jgi:hypothetical protein
MRVTTRIAALGVVVLLLTPAVSKATDILFLTGSAVPSAADQAILDRLTLTLGYSVTQEDAHIATPVDWLDHTLLILSASVGSSTAKGRFDWVAPTNIGGDGAMLRNAAKPILNFQNGLSDELGFTLDANGGQGTGSNAGSSYPAGGNDIKIVNAASPLAAGLSAGFQPVFTSNGPTVSVFGNTNFSFLGNRLVPAANIVATITSPVFGNAAIDSAYVGIVALEQGDALGNTAADPDYYATANSRRVEFPLGPNTFPTLNANGLALFDAAVAYALAGPAVPEPSTFVLAAMGLASLGIYGWRSRRRV